MLKFLYLLSLYVLKIMKLILLNDLPLILKIFIYIYIYFKFISFINDCNFFFFFLNKLLIIYIKFFLRRGWREITHMSIKGKSLNNFLTRGDFNIPGQITTFIFIIKCIKALELLYFRSIYLIIN